MQCVILAGGLGTRMRPFTQTVPKALLDVAGRPFADHQLELLSDQGFTDVVFSVGYLGDMIRDHVGTGRRWGLHVSYVDEGARLRGTAGALRLAIEHGVVADQFAVLYGDSYLPIDVEPVADAFTRGGMPALMTVLHNRNRWDASNVAYADGMVLRYEKGVDDPAMEYIDYGLGWWERFAIEERVEPGRVSDLADLYRDLSRQGLLAGYEVHERFYEIGSPAGLAELEARMRRAPNPRPDGDPPVT